MTIEELKQHCIRQIIDFERFKGILSVTLNDFRRYEEHQTILQLIETLEQQPCEDCISRQEAVLQVQRYGVGCFDAKEFSPEQCERFVIQKLNELPPVAQKEKTGHWIFKNDNIAIPTGYYQCSECEEGKLLNEDNFCPNCGARMVSE